VVDTWLPRKRLAVRPTTAYRYAWIVHHYILPTLGSIALRDLRSDHLDHLYAQLLSSGGRDRNGLAPKTVHETHVIVRSALDLAVERRLVDHNVARTAQPPRPRVLDRSGPQSWTAAQLNEFLASARNQRLYPALHLAADTGRRRGEIVGRKWSDLNVPAARLSISRTLQNVGGRPTEFGVKTRTSRRCVDLDARTLSVLASWRRRCTRRLRQRARGPVGAEESMRFDSALKPLWWQPPQGEPTRASRRGCRLGWHATSATIRFHVLR
jgi:integrase